MADVQKSRASPGEINKLSLGAGPISLGGEVHRAHSSVLLVYHLRLLVLKGKFNGDSMNKQPVVECSYERHADAVQDIFNQVISTSTALYDYEERSAEEIKAWFEAKRNQNMPIIGIENDEGRLIAFGSYGPFRNFPAFKYTVEHSVYVDVDRRGQGLGRRIIEALVSRAEQEGYHALIGAIDADNAASCNLHQRIGFERVGILPQVGYKFGRWLDLVLYQRTLETPQEPSEG